MLDIYNQKGDGMDIQIRRKQILVEMAQIETMEKGRLTEEYRDSYKNGKPIRLGPYFKHQYWEDGKNISRRVPVSRVEELGNAVDGYHRFEALSKEYVQLTVEKTRDQSAEEGKKKP
jgi:hypothetical protein